MPSSRKPKNANRRLGDRLWAPDGTEYGRKRGPGYYLTEAELRSALSVGGLRVALQGDHSAIEWPDSVNAQRLLREARRSYPLRVDGKEFMPTLWQKSEQEWLLLLEEAH